MENKRFVLLASHDPQGLEAAANQEFADEYKVIAAVAHPATGQTLLLMENPEEVTLGLPDSDAIVIVAGDDRQDVENELNLRVTPSHKIVALSTNPSLGEIIVVATSEDANGEDPIEEKKSPSTSSKK